MKEISKAAVLSQIYTNHSVMATYNKSSNANVHNSHIMTHRSETSLQLLYTTTNVRPTTDLLAGNNEFPPYDLECKYDICSGIVKRNVMQ